MCHTKAMPAFFAFPLIILILWQGGPCRKGKMDTAVNGKAERVQTGLWGGEHIRMQVSDEGARIEYDCAHGTISEPLVTDSGGRFDVKGSHTKERGGPVREGEHSDGQPARYSGRIDGQAMTLTVTLAERKETVGTFNLTYGKSPRIVKCL